MKIVIFLSIISLLIGLLFFDNIKGYYRFKELCEIEKNNQIIIKVRPNVGWVFNEGIPSTTLHVFPIADFPHVKFVRFKDYDDKKLYDARYLGGNKSQDKSYEIKLANLNEFPMYAWEKFETDLPGELRTNRYGDKVIDLKTKKVVVSVTNIGYSLFNRSHTLFDASSGNTCRWYQYLGNSANKTLVFG